MSNSEQIMSADAKRMMDLADQCFGGLAGLARALGKDKNNLYSYKYKNVGIGKRLLKDLEQVGINTVYIQTGLGLPFADNEAGYALTQKWKQYDVNSVSQESLNQFVAQQKPKYTTSPEIKAIALTAPSENDVVIPLLNENVRAGVPMTLSDDSESFNVTRHYRGTFAVDVAGDSMIDAGIEEGDRLIFKGGQKWRTGDIVLARYENELTVKCIVDGSEGMFLVPANANYDRIEIKDDSEFECIGVLVDIIRKPKKIKF